MASRFNQRDSRNALFSNYDAQTRSSASASPSNNLPPRASSRQTPYSTYHQSTSSTSSSPYGGGGGSFAGGAHDSSHPPPGAGFSAYPGGSSGDNLGGGRASGDGGFRSATPNRKGQYSDAVLSELESQNDEQTSEMSKKVKMLKDVEEDEYEEREWDPEARKENQKLT